MIKLFAKVLGSEGLRSATLVTVGNITATMLSAIAMIIFSRQLGPADFGVFSVLFSLLLILSKVGDFGINVAVQREIAKRTDDETSDTATAQTGSYLKVIIMAVVVIIGVALGPWIADTLLHIGENSALVIAIFALSGTVVFYEYVNTILQAKQLFGLSVISNFVQSTGKLICALALFFVGMSLGTITLLYVIFPLLGGLVGLVKLAPRYFAPRLHKKTAIKLVNVAKWTSVAILSASMADNIDVLLVQNYMSSYDTGLWSAAVRIASLASLIGWSLGTVLNVRVASYTDKKNLSAYLKKAGVLAVVALLGVSAAALLSGPAIFYTVGPEFLDAVTPLNLLLFSTAILTASTPFVALFYLFDKPAYYAYSGLLGTAALLIGDIVLIPQFGLIGAGYARILTRLAVLIFTLYYARRAYVERYG